MPDSNQPTTVATWAACILACVASWGGCRGAPTTPAPDAELSKVLALDLTSPTEPDPESPLWWWNAEVVLDPARAPDPVASAALLQLRRESFQIQTLSTGSNPRWTPLDPGAVGLPHCRAVRLSVDLAYMVSLYERDQPDLARGVAQLEAFSRAVGATPPKTNQTLGQVRARLKALDALVNNPAIVSQAEVRVVPKGEPFPARRAYEVLTAMGLRRVDFDCLALLAADAFGGDSLLTVDGGDETLCFSATRLAEASFDALVWRMHVPRSPDPEAVFAAMWRGAQAAAAALGGELMDPRRDVPADREVLAAEVSRTAQTMRAAGLQPGSHAALVVSWE